MVDVETPLREWNRLNHENHQNLMVAKMAEALLSNAPQSIDQFANWFIAGIGASAAIFLSNVDKISPFLGIRTYRMALIFFGISILFGVLSKVVGTYVLSFAAMHKVIVTEVEVALKKYDEQAAQIKLAAEENKLDINTDFDLHAVMQKFDTLQTPLGRWLRARSTRKQLASANPMLETYRMPFKGWRLQVGFVLLSMLSAVSAISTVAVGISGLTNRARSRGRQLRV